MNFTLRSLLGKLNQNPGERKSFKLFLGQEVGLMKVVFKGENTVSNLKELGLQ